jgi:hypothetical protein
LFSLGPGRQNAGPPTARQTAGSPIPPAGQAPTPSSRLLKRMAASRRPSSPADNLAKMEIEDNDKPAISSDG